MAATITDSAESCGVALLLMNPRELSRATSVLRHGTARDELVAELIVLVARAIELYATNVRFCDLVKLAPAFAEDAARAAVEGMLTTS